MSSDEIVFYATVDGTREGRSSHFHRAESNAANVVDQQNARALELGIKARYHLADCDAKGIESKNIRD